MSKQTFITVPEHGTHYMVDGEEVFYQPMLQGTPLPLAEEWNLVETELVGEEEVPYKGKTTKLKSVHADIKSRVHTIAIVDALEAMRNAAISIGVNESELPEIGTWREARRKALGATIKQLN
jgi:hypothetical protein